MTTEQIEQRIWRLILSDEKLQKEKVGYIRDVIINMAEKIKGGKNRCKDQ